MIIKINEKYLDDLNFLAKNFNIKYKFENLNSDFNHIFGYICDDKLVAFIDFSVYFERAEINYIFVDEKFRNKKIATNLLNFILINLNGVESISLEVRENNTSAIKFYLKNGFEKCSVRKKYYGNEDALLLIKKCGE